MTRPRGRLPKSTDFGPLKYAAEYLDSPWPTPTYPVTVTEGITDWGMCGNDVWGDCVAEGSEVHAPSLSAAIRAPYEGPMVTIRTESGRVLTVTPNHGVLTPTGFTRARLLKQGDDVIGGDFRHVSRHLSPAGIHFNQTPAAVEQVLAAADRREGAERMTRAVHFHGDERFVNGDVHVVATHGLLDHERDPALGEPQREEQVESAGLRQRSLRGSGPLRQRQGIRGLPPLGGIGVGGHRPSGCGTQDTVHARPGGMRIDRAAADALQFTQQPVVADAHFGGDPQRWLSSPVAGRSGQQSRFVLGTTSDHLQSSGLSPRAYGHAGRLEAAREGVLSDPELYAELACGFPGHVAPDRVVEIYHHSFSGHVFDLSTGPHWYVSNGIISHNCFAAAEWHLEMATSAAVGTTLKEPKTGTGALRRARLYWGKSVTGPPGPGAVLLTYLKWLRSRGAIKAFAPLDHTDPSQLAYFAQAGYGVYVGVNLNPQAETQFNATQPWQVGPTDQPTPDMGHCILFSRQTTSAGPFYFVTWGKLQQATATWVKACLTTNATGEAFLIVTTEDELKPFSAQLEADCKELSEAT